MKRLSSFLLVLILLVPVSFAQTPDEAAARVDSLLDLVSDARIVYGVSQAELDGTQKPASSATQRDRMAAALSVLLADERLARTAFADWQANRTIAGATSSAVSRPYRTRAELIGYLYAQSVRLRMPSSRNVNRNRIRTVANDLGLLMKLHAAEWPDVLDSPLDPVTYFRGVR